VRLRVYLGYKGITAETVGGYDIKGYSQRKRLKNLRPQPADFLGGTYSIVTEIVAPLGVDDR
jgi:hypothetical protein